MKSPDVLVVGAGAIGCSVAYHLSGAGGRVLVLDPAGPAREASSAAAGILSNLEAALRKDPTAAIGRESLELFPAFIRRLEGETGLSTGYARTGYLLLRPEGRAAQGRARRVFGRELRALEPGLDPREEEALFEPGAATILPRLYTRALAAACRKRGVRFLRERVMSFQGAGGRLLAARTRRGPYHAGQFALCAGAWSGLLGEPVPVRPARGQLLILRSRPAAIRHVVELGGRYLTPHWGRGLVLAGSTVESVGFRRGVSRSAMAELGRFAAGVLPELSGARALRRFSGLRPEPIDGLPILGRLPDWNNLWIASGHFRRGIILSPWTGRTVARWIQKGGVPAEFDVFSPGRFRAGRRR